MTAEAAVEKGAAAGDVGWRGAVREAWLPLLLELGARLLRLPLFPGFALLLGERSPRQRAACAILLAAIEVSFLGAPGAELVAGALAGAVVARHARRRLGALAAFALGSTVIWSLISWASGRFPVGALSAEVVLTAVLVRVAGGEVPAALGSRLVLTSVAYGSASLARLPGRWLRALAPALLVLALSSCGRDDRAYFDPEALASAGQVEQIAPGSSSIPAGTHPVFPAERRPNELCLACHGAKVGPTDLPLARKGMHERHYQQAGFDRPCVFCHESAGRPGFPGERPQLGARREYNQRCSTCHSRDGAPHWNRRSP